MSCGLRIAQAREEVADWICYHIGLPTGFLNTGQFTACSELTEADAAQAEVPEVSVSASAAPATVYVPGAEFWFAP